MRYVWCVMKELIDDERFNRNNFITIADISIMTGDSPESPILRRTTKYQ